MSAPRILNRELGGMGDQRSSHISMPTVTAPASNSSPVAKGYVLLPSAAVSPVSVRPDENQRIS